MAVGARACGNAVPGQWQGFATGGTARGGWSYFGVYFGARVLHTVCYMTETQPWRTASFFVGQLAQFGLIVQILMKAF